MKKCRKCSSCQIVKNGKRLGKQRLLCNDCKYVREMGNSIKKNKIDSSELLHDVVINNKVYRQLAEEHGTNIKLIQRSLDENDFKKNLMIK